MKTSINVIRQLLTISFIVIGFSAMAQHQEMQYLKMTPLRFIS